jgi:hypothetical protein
MSKSIKNTGTQKRHTFSKHNIKFQIHNSSRVYQAIKLYLFAPSSGLYSCPLAMTDGAAKTIQVISHFF